ncbi:MAG TPA: DCC1-like thiol-disulfide oxidoreductase family protein [Gaiellaceae bacterium]|nr:DCC1-like thiol-disulfide oxidoreductase family protein [Gaiellaceae bacterium]
MLVYDGDCGFCTRGIALLARWFRPTAPAAPAEGKLDAVEWIGAGERLAGADAIAAWLRTGRRLRPLIALIPVGLPVGRIVYPVVARNRGRISRLLDLARRR